ncbi:Oidioi.mRNA.OKI2018_I69.chr1.g815.t1.cds [Oikopleura dioica]|uniref:Oidioi.mRNA.OKI2018_I69.chr1.g815.t1.cds n=1 Tax=Oikopleura dioica TaxID=34765 RepID=A0ABN7SSD4_OIKDI|nr:Oidioi.mRNA.OKI2018_I69.chr1.g815.t1.cds [Oikopleura dioica]
MAKVQSLRSEKMPADVACFISHSPEWKALTASMFDLSPSLLDNKPQRHRHLPRTKSFAPSPSAKATQLYNTIQMALNTQQSKPKPIRKSKTTKERKVTFADDHGKPLCKEKIFTEKPDEPSLPRPSEKAVLERLRLAIPSETTPRPKTFEICFPQPMSDYLKFKRKVDEQNVSLENMVIRHRTILGTIKVKNIAFEKNVTVRISFDGWETFSDVEATYIRNAYEGEWTNTFKFTTSIPKNYDSTKTIEFCICYAANDTEFWDNNDGENYRLLCVNPELISPTGEGSPLPAFLPEKIPAPANDHVFY